MPMDDREARFEQLLPHVLGCEWFDLYCSDPACYRHDKILGKSHQRDDEKFRRRACENFVARGWIVRDGKPICPDCAKGRNPDRSYFGWNVRERGVPARLKPSTILDLHRVEGQAELIGGRIVRYQPAGFRPAQIAGRIFASLHEYTEASGRGDAYTSTIGFVVPELTSGRESFLPDAAYYDGPLPDNDMDFIAGPPTLAVEVRSRGDYGPAAEAEMAAKRADYFEAGTRVVWDVDSQAECIRVYRPDEPERPVTFAKGQVADAEPAVPG